MVAMHLRVLLLSALFGGALLLSACGTGANSSTTSLSTTTTAPSTTTTGVTQDLPVTPSVRKSIFDAAAAYHQLPPSDYLGLNAGATYYAFDPATDRYYAAAGLDPSRNSIKAEVGTQDDGAYNLFSRAASTNKWTVYDDGLGGSQEATCPLVIPAAVLKVWNWRANSCFPPI
jgi:hypothetical protein